MNYDTLWAIRRCVSPKRVGDLGIEDLALLDGRVVASNNKVAVSYEDAETRKAGALREGLPPLVLPTAEFDRVHKSLDPTEMAEIRRGGFVLGDEVVGVERPGYLDVTGAILTMAEHPEVNPTFGTDPRAIRLVLGIFKAAHLTPIIRTYERAVTFAASGWLGESLLCAVMGVRLA